MVRWKTFQVEISRLLHGPGTGYVHFGQGRFGQSWKNLKSDRFGQFLRRSQKRRQIDYSVDYRDDAGFREAVRALIALGHMPANWKQHYYQGFLAVYGNDPRIARFCQFYFHPTWIAGLFPLHIWDWHNSEHRTNNNIESFHATMKRFFAHPHLTIYKFVALFFQLSSVVATTTTFAPPMGILRHDRIRDTQELTSVLKHFTEIVTPSRVTCPEWQTWFPTPSICNFCKIDKIMFYVTKSSFI